MKEQENNKDSQPWQKNFLNLNNPAYIVRDYAKRLIDDTRYRQDQPLDVLLSGEANADDQKQKAWESLKENIKYLRSFYRVAEVKNDSYNAISVFNKLFVLNDRGVS
jgi:hypothetical protein